MTNCYQNYIFDLDGTIVNSSKEVLACFSEAFRQANYKIDESRLTSNVIGPPLKEIIKLIAPKLKEENKINEIVKNFRQIYDYDENDISVMYDGLYEFLLKLKSQNKKLFIATFKPQIPTFRVLKKFKLYELFDDIYTIDKFQKHITKIQMIADIIEKYNLEKNQTVMIGDAASDMIAANKNNITAIGVLWGYGQDKTSLIEHSDVTIGRIGDLECLK